MELSPGQRKRYGCIEFLYVSHQQEICLLRTCHVQQIFCVPRDPGHPLRYKDFNIFENSGRLEGTLECRFNRIFDIGSQWLTIVGDVCGLKWTDHQDHRHFLILQLEGERFWRSAATSTNKDGKKSDRHDHRP